MSVDEVPDHEILYRRVTKLKVDADGKPTSFAFRLNPGEDGRSCQAASHAAPEQCLAAFPEMGLVSVTAGDVRSCGATVVWDPDPEQPGHVLIRGGTRKTDKELSRLAKVIVPVPDPPKANA